MQKIAEWLFVLRFENFWSLVYVYPFEKIIIDTSSPANKEQLTLSFKKLSLEIEDINYVFLTHSHFDHIWNSYLFKESTIITSTRTVDIMKEKQDKYMLFHKFWENVPDFTDLNFQNAWTERFEIYETPGHMEWSICIYDNKLKILFSGDTIFSKDVLPKLDLPWSNEKALKESYQKLYEKNLNVDLLCPWHMHITRMTDFNSYIQNLENKLNHI